MGATPTIDARRRHYRHFYGLEPISDDRPLAVVIGNCQAESLRLFLGEAVATVHVPPVHELVASDVPHLQELLSRTSVLVTQPIHDDYHGLPVGTSQSIGRLPAGARHAVVPVVRFAGLYPVHAIVRSPLDASLQPPVVPYHDLRVLAEASGSALGTGRLRSAQIREVAALSVAELRKRELAYDTVRVSDLFAAPRFESMRTLNHPGNPVWAELAARVHDATGIAGPTGDPGRPVLDGIHAPREEDVIETWGLDDDPVDVWRVGGSTVAVSEVRAAHLAWYAEHPEIVDAGLRRHADTLRILGAA